MDYAVFYGIFVFLYYYVSRKRKMQSERCNITSLFTQMPV
ncbi:hypothetical protein SAMN06298211_107107 [Prevotellaceae bacterium MN60]|nr:hypothetical protein SAMN06298211_107107 [Prevotellaceae bacterium MN60]